MVLLDVYYQIIKFGLTGVLIFMILRYGKLTKVIVARHRRVTLHLT